jgi:hypothetical protein
LESGSPNNCINQNGCVLRRFYYFRHETRL